MGALLLIAVVGGQVALNEALSQESGVSDVPSTAKPDATRSETRRGVVGLSETALWALLKVGAANVAICLSVLLWYVRHFLDSLHAAEKDSPEMRQALAQSPRIFAILAGVGFVVASSVLAYLVLWEGNAFCGNAPAIHSCGFWLLVLTLSAPAAGAVTVGLVALAEIGWLKGLMRAVTHLSRYLLPFPRRPVLLAGPRQVLGSASIGPPERAFVARNETAAVWEVSRRWVQDNERAWGLGRGFLRANESTLVAIVASCWQRRVANRPDTAEPDHRLEGEVAREIVGAMSDPRCIRARIFKRPLQIARAACALYAKYASQSAH
ncbi:MAG TPA: hypothetical protein PKK06_07460 [Phycisphaerae bacterium]|nr:hypothetical protein [Phycisphaerae bacterium]HNU46593.1 hypothetical protein [Phycisphaerae bacterium]